MGKVIHPLSDRLVHDMPLLKNGVIYLKHLHAMAIAIGCEDTWDDECMHLFEDELPVDYVLGRETLLSIKSCLQEIYKWVSRTPGSGQHIPWDDDDMDAIVSQIDAWTEEVTGES